MSCPPPARQFSDPDEDILVLERALNWRAAPPPPTNSLAASMVLHVAVLTAFLAYFPGASMGLHAASEQHPVSHSFISLVFPKAMAPPPTVQAALQFPGHPDILQTDASDMAQTKVTVNLNSISLSFADDVRNQLPAVVASQHGMLALLDKQDLSVAYYLMQPPTWTPRPTITDVSRHMRFKMEPARKWPVFRQAAERYGVDLDRFVGCAVFDAAFARCLKAAIRGRLGPDAAGPVSSVQLAFATDHACGVEVLEVSLARNPAPQP